MFTEQLALVWMDDSAADSVGAGVDGKIDSFAEGGLEHGTEIILVLLEIATEEDDTRLPANAPSAVSPVPGFVLFLC